MIRLVACIVFSIGAANVVVGGLQLLSPPASAYSAGVRERIYHADPNCPERAKDQAILPLPTKGDAERFGNPCPHCVKD